MARRRALALLHTKKAVVCGVASRHLATARALGEELGCRACFADFHRLPETGPEAVLVEVPNAAQDEIVRWALSQGLHVLLGGPLSVSARAGTTIGHGARSRGLVVEAGYEARYKAAWEETRQRIADGQVGRVVAVRTVALWDCRPGSWYSFQRESAGMPLAHMTYAFVNPLRWILGEPTHVSAFASRLKNTAEGAVTEETCVANLLFPGSVLCSMTAGFVKPFADESWGVWVLGTEGGIELYPSEMGNGRLAVHHRHGVEAVDCSAYRDAFVVQAEAFLASLGGQNQCRNRPEETVGDLRVAEAVAESVRSMRTVFL